MSKYIDWDFLIEDLIYKTVQKDWICCDVGSCVGRITNLFIDICKNGQVFAFDINKNNPFINGCINERMAISDIDGFESVYDVGSHMSNILGYDVGRNISQYVYDTPSIKLDTYFKNRNIDCIKIDIEGAELKAIKGGIETLKKSKLVIIECHMDDDWIEIYDLLTHNKMEFYELSTNEKIIRDFTIGPRGERPYQIYKIKC